MVQIGDGITYQINWHNYHEEPARVIIMDTLDPGADFAEASDGGVYHETAGDMISALEEGGEAIPIPAHTVVWVLEERPANAEGIVTLVVTVNENAKAAYNYNDDADGLVPDKNPDDSIKEDYMVLNQARVKVGNDSFIKTQIMKNPVPEKTETEVDHADDTLDTGDAIVLTPKEGEKNIGVIPEEDTASADFENSIEDDTPKYGNLRVTKTVAGNAGDKSREWHFRVELSDKSINGQYGDMFFTNGVAEFILKHGGHKTATGLPENTTYIVIEREADRDGYTTSSTGENGTIVSEQTMVASFVNDKPTVPHDGPKTGDNSRLGMWIALLVVSLFGILVSSLLLYKGRRDDRKQNKKS